MNTQIISFLSICLFVNAITLFISEAEAAQMDFVGEVSPNKDKIVFYSYRGGKPDLFIANLDGSGETNLTSSPEYWDIEPVWSLDGHTIYFSRGESMQNLNIFALDVESLVLKQITDSEQSDSGVSISPDGHSIAFNRQWDEFKRGSIFIKSLKTGDEQMVVQSKSQGQVALKPRWNKTGTGFIYTFSESGGLATHNLYFHDLHKRKSEAIYTTPGRVRMPNWAYGGERIIFSSNFDGKEVSKDNYFKVYLLDLESKKLISLTKSQNIDEYFSYHIDGTDEVFFDAGTWKDGFKIYHTNLDTKIQKHITQR